jgi:hypothetical protein
VDQLIAGWAVYENQLPGAVDQKDLP